MKDISPQTKIRFVQKVGCALHQCGAAAQHLESALTVSSAKLGLTSEHLSLPTGLISCYEGKDYESSKMIRLNPGGVDLDKLSRVDEIADQVIDGDLSIEEGRARIDTAMKTKSPYPPWVHLLSYSFAAGGVSVCLNGSIYDVISSLILGALVGAMVVLAPNNPTYGRVLGASTSFVTAVLATILEKYIPSISAKQVILSSLIVLVPGLSLIVSMAEISTRNLVSGTAKLMGATAELMKLVFCVAIGTKIVTWFLGESGNYEGVPVPSFYEIPSMAIVGLSFIIIFNTRRQDLTWAMICALLGYFSAKIGAYMFSSELGFFIGGTSVAASSNLFSKKLCRPSLVFLLPGVILMVPGSLSYKSLSSLFENQLFNSMEAALATLTVGVAIVIGLFLGNTLITPRRCL